MKGMNGREMVEQLTKMLPDIKVFYMSGYTNDVIIDAGLLNENVTLIEKPFTCESLIEKVSEALISGRLAKLTTNGTGPNSHAQTELSGPAY